MNHFLFEAFNGIAIDFKSFSANTINSVFCKVDLFSLFDSEFLSAIVAIMTFYLVATIVGGVLYGIGMFRDIPRLSTPIKRWGRILSILAGLALMLSGLGKIIGLAPMVAKFTQFNMIQWFPFVGANEIVIGLLMLFPKTYKLGFLLAVATLGGAIATHLPTHSDGVAWAIPSASVMFISWISALLSTPEIFPDFICKMIHGKKQQGIPQN